MTDLTGFIAKWDDAGHTHPLLYHMIDSGTVARELWQTGLTAGARRMLSAWLGLGEEEAGSLIAYWVSLHDVGKASPSFQARCAAAKAALTQAGFGFPPLLAHDVRHHSLLSAWILDRQPERLHLQPLMKALDLELALAGHHGKFPFFGEFTEETFQQSNLGSGAWAQAQDQLVRAMEELFCPPENAHVSDSRPITNACFSILTGLFITADWLASNTALFPYHAGDLAPQQYKEKVAEPAARAALHVTGWGSWQPEKKVLAFEDLFPKITPNSIQQGVLRHLGGLQEPFLLILEAPTGSGKTETALCVADTFIQQHDLRGFYVAMPTQATSDQMFDRVERYLLQRYPGKTLNFQLAHGNALLKEEYEKIQLAGIADADDNPRSGVNALSWFTPRKLTLLAPFGVGTVDQSLLSVLQARHFALRLFGLARKVIVFDEVHAYDAFLSVIFKRLLGWLRALGSSVVILTATLPQQTRLELLQAFDPNAHTESAQAAFPRLSINSGGAITTVALGAVEDRTAGLEFIDQKPESIVEVLRQKLDEGGCAGVVCNTVRRAQEVYAAVKACGQFRAEEVLLFHARYPFSWREDRQKAVLSAFGRLEETATACRRKVVIATQVIEQSLDLDFDLLITDLAPVDLLIQRIGRLQRHSDMKYSPVRPPKLSQPLCVVAAPVAAPQGLPQFERSDTLIYAEVFLQRTYALLQGRRALSLPHDSDELIEGVYSSADLPGLAAEQNAAIRALYQKMVGKNDDKIIKAERHLIADVNFQDLLGQEFDDLADEEDTRVHSDLRALTRDVRPSVKLVCLQQEADGTLYTLDGHYPVNLGQKPDHALTKALLRSAVTVSDYRVVAALRGQLPHPAWKELAALRYLYPLGFVAGEARIGDGPVCMLDEELGLRVAGEPEGE